MGFGFVLFFIFILLPLWTLLIIAWLITRKKIFVKVVVGISIAVVAFISFVTLLQVFTSKKVLDKNDIYGEYVIDKTKFPGKQADWQYDHFHFKIVEPDSFVFYVTEEEKLIHTYKGTVRFLNYSTAPRIILNVDSPAHHAIEKMPTLYRETWSFYYVFKSPRFGNMFFRKGEWNP